jgi:hypothetical protein
MLTAADRVKGLTGALARTLADPRGAARVTRAWTGVLTQRIFAIACGCPDGNNADGLAGDPIRTKKFCSIAMRSPRWTPKAGH